MAAHRSGHWLASSAGAALLAFVAPFAAAQVVVFAPGTDPAYIEEVSQHIAARRERLGLDERFTLGARWNDGGMNGDPIAIAYSLLPDGQMLPGQVSKPQEPAGPSRLFVDFDTMFDGARSFWLALFDEVFNGTRYSSWGSICGITFTRVTGPPVDPDGPGPLPPAPVDWDDDSPWGTNGPILGGTGSVGDIRIAGKFIDGIGGVYGYAYPPDDPQYPGEIVLDIDEFWEDPTFGFRRVANILSHLVGIAIGLEAVCPIDNTKIMEPLANEKDILGPGLDDWRGANALYGDRLENNDALDTFTAKEFPFDPVASLLGQTFEERLLSIDTLTDQDFFYIVIPEELGETVDIDVRIEVIPIGRRYDIGTANVSGACGGVNLTPDDARITQNFRFSLRDSNGVSVAEYRDFSGDLLTPDGLGYINIRDPGQVESGIGTITTPGVYFIEVSSSGGADPLNPQMYDLLVQIGNQIFSNGTPLDVPVVDVPPIGIGSSYITNQPDLGLLPPGADVYTGLRATFGQLDAQHPSLGHYSLIFPDANTPNTRNFGQARVAWPGGATTQPSVGGVSNHATIAAAAAVGNPEGVFPAGSIGPAFESSIISGSVATRVFNNGTFNLQREGLTYAIYTLASPAFAAAAGLPNAATVISNPFGFSGDLRGDTYISQLYDAISLQYGVTIVAGTGNAGAIDATAQCGGSGQNVPGGPFRGARTLAAPATAYNVIGVGSIAKSLPDDAVATPAGVNPRGDALNIVPDFSGKGPADSFNYTTQTLVPNARVGVDLVAPGTGYVVVAEDPQELDPPDPPCSYPGHQNAVLLSAPFLDPLFDSDLDNPSNPSRFAGTSGTSISAGMTAGAVALLQDYALAQDPPLSIAPEVIRAILLASATPQLGWTNTQNPAKPQDNRDGADSLIQDPDTQEVSTNPALVVRNGTRPGDYVQGAGVLNLRNAYTIYRGAHIDPLSAFFVPVIPGTETRDPSQTNPNVPTITDPPREQQDINPNPFGVTAGAESTLTMEDLPPSPLDIARALYMANGDVPAEPVMTMHADFGDAKLDQVNGEKSAAGTTFTPRPPFKLPPSPGNRPGSNPIAPPPVELQDKIIVGPIGWDHGQIGQRVMSLPAKQPAFPTAGPIRTGYIDYFIAFPFDGTINLSVALAWQRTAKIKAPNFSNPDDPQIGELTSLEHENLDVQLIQCDAFGEILEDHVFFGTIGVDEGGQIWDGSNSIWETTEYFSSAPTAGFYVLRVRWVGSNYDLFRNEVDGSVKFGLAWTSDFFGGFLIPTAQGASASAAMAVADGNVSPGTRVIRRAMAALGSRIGDSRYDAAFDANRDGRIVIGEVLKIKQIWAGR